MTGLEFAASVIQSIAWPATLVLSVLILRASLGQVLTNLASRLKRAELPGGAALNFEEQAQAERNVVSEALDEVLASVKDDTGAVRQQVDKLVDASAKVGAYSALSGLELTTGGVTSFSYDRSSLDSMFKWQDGKMLYTPPTPPTSPPRIVITTGTPDEPDTQQR